MRVLFETQGQGFVFLLMIYLGLLLGALDQVICALWQRGHKVWGVVCCLLTCGVGTVGGVWLLVWAEQDGLRAYGLLGILTGWLIYALGFGKLFEKLAGHLGKSWDRWREKRDKYAGEAGNAVRKENT